MPEYLAPGVFVEETTFRQKTIEGVGTSTAAFVGAARFGPIRGEPELLTSFEDFQRIYGGLDQLTIAGGEVDNHLAHAIRAFFENGGRRAYVARVIHSDEGARPATASNVISPTGPGGSPRLDLAARHPGRAGNFQLRLTVRIGRNILDPAPVGGGPPVLKGASEYDTVLVDGIAIGGANQSAQFFYLRDAFDAAQDVWTYELRSNGVNHGLVTDLDTSLTKDVRLITVDVEVRELGEFLQPEFWPGLALHHEHLRSLHATFGETPSTRAMELFVPLVVTSTPAEADGPSVAEVLLGTAGTLDALRNTAFDLGIDATGGSFRLRVNGTETAAINHPATAADVQAAVEALAAVGPGDVTVEDQAGGLYTITFEGALGGTAVSLTADGVALTGLAAGVSAQLQPFDVTIVVPPAATAGNFRIIIDGDPTGDIAFDADQAAVQLAVDAVLTARADTAAGDIAVAGDGRTLTVPGALGDTALPVIAVEDVDLDVAAGLTAMRANTAYEVDITATGGTFTLTVNGVTTAALPFDALAVTVSDALEDLASVGPGNVDVALPPGGPYTVTFEGALAGQPVTLEANGAALTGAAGTATVTARGAGVLAVEPGGSSLIVDVAEPPQVTVRLAGGDDGGAFPDPLGYEGSIDPGTRLKSGLKAFEDLPDVSIVGAPGSTQGYGNRQPEADTIIGLLIAHAERMRYRIAVVDSPPQLLPGEALDVRGRFDSKHAAFYYPWVTVFDPVTRTERNMPPSGFVAGIYARNDIERGVHKAPANEIVRLAIGFEATVSTAQQELLNPEGVNCFRSLDRRGRRLWGARTMSSDPEWKYVNLRRYFAFLEASIDRGTQWAVFEPNGERLWANVQTTVADFLFGEFVNGHLLGITPDEAFFVRCDRSTMTQNDLDNGRLVCLIGVAPLRPAEFVIFRIGQKTLDAVGA